MSIDASFAGEIPHKFNYYVLVLLNFTIYILFNISTNTTALAPSRNIFIFITRHTNM